MKKFIKILIGMTLASSLTACGTNAGSINSSEKTTAESKTESVDKNSDETKTSDENKILVVYYSATGSTEKVANNIAISNVSFIGTIPIKSFPNCDIIVTAILTIQNIIINITNKYVENFFIYFSSNIKFYVRRDE